MSFTPYTSTVRFHSPLGTAWEQYLADMQAVFTPTRWKGDGTEPVVIIAMGSGSDWSTMFHPDLITPVVRAVLAAGAAAAVSPFGGDLYANPTARTAMTALVDHCTGPAVGAAPAVGWFGFSMGGQSALVWAGHHRDRTAFVTAAAPLVDVTAIAGSPALDAAYPGGWTEVAHGADTNPITLAAAGAYTDLPITCAYSTDDTLITPTAVHTFAATAGPAATTIAVGALGHDWPTATHPDTLHALTTHLERIRP